ncbi:MAG: ComF family protein [Nitrospinales bacterium]
MRTNSRRETFLRDILDKLLDVLFPQKCVYCEGEREDGGPFLCGLCREDLVWITRPFCDHCGRPAEIGYDFPHQEFKCAVCRKDAPYFDRARSLGLYETVLKQLILLFKYGRQPGIVEEIEPLLQAYFAEEKGNCRDFLVVPAPLHVAKMKERGFDQSYLIAREVAKAADLPLDAGRLVRIKKTEPQAGMSKGDRLQNVRGAFRVTRPEELKGRNILLVDDVFTTGATVNEAARVLKKSGARRVFVFTLARA